MAYTTYPFSAIFGQERLKKALIYNLINPRIGGVLITGQKGTAKSTAVRALGELTQKKVITLPLSVTEDRLIGSVDLEQTMKTGKAVYLPGILAEADGQILYVDEVNLLQDHLTDIVLTAHASMENRVEREGISAVSDCRFLLVGTMNPEEGELRQHFLDQFGLCVVIGSENKPEQRLAIVKAAMAYEDNPKGFAASFAPLEAELREKIEAASNLLPSIKATEANRLYIVSKCLEAEVQGHRADLTLEETAKAVAAWNGHTEITQEDIDIAAPYVLLHRRRNTEQPPEEEPQEQQEQEPQEQNDVNDAPPPDRKDSDGPPPKNRPRAVARTRILLWAIPLRLPILDTALPARPIRASASEPPLRVRAKWAAMSIPSSRTLPAIWRSTPPSAPQHPIRCPGTRMVLPLPSGKPTSEKRCARESMQIFWSSWWTPAAPWVPASA